MARILLLIPSATGVGGAERMVSNLSRLLAEEHEVFETSFDVVGSERRFPSNAPFYPLGWVPHLPLPIRWIAYAVKAIKLRRMKSRLRIAITISNLWGADLISILSRGDDRKIALCHINIMGNAANRLMVRFRPFVAWIYRKFDRVIAVNSGLAVELKDLYRLSSDRVGHINNFIDMPEVDGSLLPEGTIRFVWCGRFSPEKNVDGLLSVWAAFASQTRGVQLVLLGDGGARAEMYQLAVFLGLRLGVEPHDKTAQVIFAGKVAKPASWMFGARALLLTSHAEGLPMVILEALSLGLPVLASDCQSGGVREALLGQGRCDPRRREAENGPAGILLPVPNASDPNTLSLWCEALNRAAKDDYRWERWRQGALDRSREFSREVARSKWLDAIQFADIVA